MTMWVVNGPSGETTVEAEGRWDACNYQRMIDRGLECVDLTDIAAEIVTTAQPLRKIKIIYLSDKAVYSATEVANYA